ncbi:hypothetical protein [Kitasatospora sp. McL0602]|uniref:hypothetical protein n=1 Tax=Kitasatospora sp. McL0602 TaxID=3439530 RepID=UPI003F8B1718
MLPKSKVDLYAAIRRDSRAGLSQRALQRKYGVGFLTVQKALESALRGVAGPPASPVRRPRSGLQRRRAHCSSTELLLQWAHVTYHYRALRSARTCAWLPASVFVTVLQGIEDGDLIVGRSSASTAHPRQRALPGRSAEPPQRARRSTWQPFAGTPPRNCWKRPAWPPIPRT